MQGTLLFSDCVVDRPSSFRNVKDSKSWKALLLKDKDIQLQAEYDFLDSLGASFPVSCYVSLRILHLYNVPTKLRDTDNTAKPIMDAFNKILFNDDKQVRDLHFVSAPLFSNLAKISLQENGGHFSGVLNSTIKNACDIIIEHLTLIEIRDISTLMADSGDEYFLGRNRASLG